MCVQCQREDVAVFHIVHQIDARCKCTAAHITQCQLQTQHTLPFNPLDIPRNATIHFAAPSKKRVQRFSYDFSEQNPSPAAGAVASLYYSLSLSSAAGLPDFVALPDLAETHLNSHHTHIFTNLILSCRAYRAVAGQTTQCLRPVCAREGN